LPPGEEFAAALDEAWRGGAAVLPMDPAAPPDVRRRTLEAMRPDDGAEVDVALVITTSGSTGVPKGAELSHVALAASARATMARIGRRDDDCWLACLPWHHIGGLQVLLRARMFDTPLVVHERFDVTRFAAEEQPTLVSLVPTQLLRLLDAGVPLDRFRAILLGGAPAPATLLERAGAAGARVVTTYGMSETCGGCVYDGVPLDGVQMRVDDDGRVRLRGPVLMSRYRLQPALTSETLRDGWFLTSDLGSIGSDGRLSVHGRVDDVVVTGGEKVVTTQVAAVLATHPQVMDVEVAGVPDTEWGERLVAVVVTAGAPSDASRLTAELRDWCRRSLPAAAAPRDVLVVDEIPRLASGKPDRLAVQSLAELGCSGRGPDHEAQSGDTPSTA
jgi:O-succinylbenzoic acid--CoA ligase